MEQKHLDGKEKTKEGISEVMVYRGELFPHRSAQCKSSDIFRRSTQIKG